MNHAALLREMIAFDAGDPKRIHHFLKVYALVSLIGGMENLPRETQDVLEAAAIVHDIGIHAAEEKHGSADGKHQEAEGGAPAESMLLRLGYGADFAARVRYLVEHHHTYSGIDGLDYQILVEADFLVNAYEDALSEKALRSMRDKIFRTEGGKKLLREMYGPA